LPFTVLKVSKTTSLGRNSSETFASRKSRRDLFWDEMEHVVHLVRDANLVKPPRHCKTSKPPVNTGDLIFRKLA